MPRTAHINIGSNTGDRTDNLRRAVACLASEFSGASMRCSAIVESAPWGYNSPNAFLNIGVELLLNDDVDPELLLSRLLAVEKSICATPHRNPDGTYRDRAVDIDLIALDDLIVNTPTLQLPHPRMHLRDFVLRPMASLAPEWRHPVSGLTCTDMLAALAEKNKFS